VKSMVSLCVVSTSAWWPEGWLRWVVVGAGDRGSRGEGAGSVAGGACEREEGVRVAGAWGERCDGEGWWLVVGVWEAKMDTIEGIYGRTRRPLAWLAASRGFERALGRAVYGCCGEKKITVVVLVQDGLHPQPPVARFSKFTWTFLINPPRYPACPRAPSPNSAVCGSGDTLACTNMRMTS
jgi:hypothetical protein